MKTTQCDAPEISTYKVLRLPPVGLPNSVYYVLTSQGVDLYITDLQGGYHKVNSNTVTSTGGGIRSSFIAGEILSGGMLVYINAGQVFKYNQSNTNLYDKEVGFTLTSASSGEEVEVILAGECNQLGGLITGEPYYAGNNGSVVTPSPLINTQLSVGVAKNATTLIVSLGEPRIKI